MEPVEDLDYIFTFLWSMTPIGELRLAIPIGMGRYDLPWYWVLPVAVIGNLVPGIFWLLALPKLAPLLSRLPLLGSFLRWRTESLRKHNSQRFHKYGVGALALLVAIPLPVTGVWTGCLAAWTFEIPFRRALPSIALGALMAGIIVTGLTAAGIMVTE